MAPSEPRESYPVTFFRHGCNLLLVGSLAGLGLFLTSQGRHPQGPWMLLGVVIFVFAEYLNHRFLLHGRPLSHPVLRRLQRRLHYDHHRRPKDLDLLFLPLWFGLPNILLYGAVYYWLTGDWERAMSTLAGSLLALLYYEYVHFVAHIPVVPSTPWGRWMKKYHLLHHYKNEHYWYGVTNPSLDHLFGTYRQVTSVNKSGTATDLEADYVEPGRQLP